MGDVALDDVPDTEWHSRDDPCFRADAGKSGEVAACAGSREGRRLPSQAKGELK